MNHTQIGDVTEHRFILYCLEHNIPVSKPVNNNLPYDCIIDVNSQLLKIQVKTGYKSSSKDTFVFNTRSCSKNFTEVKVKTYDGLIDGFITWYEQTPDVFYYIPVEQASAGSMRIYYGNTPTSQQNNGKDYIFMHD